MTARIVDMPTLATQLQRLVVRLSHHCAETPEQAEVVALLVEVLWVRRQIGCRGDLPVKGSWDAVFLELELRRQAHQRMLSPAAVDAVCSVVFGADAAAH